MNRSLLDVKGSALVVSQFTLYGDARGQRRPSFIAAAPPEQAKKLYEEFCEALRRLGVAVATGVLKPLTSVESANEGSGHNPASTRTKHSSQQHVHEQPDSERKSRRDSSEARMCIATVGTSWVIALIPPRKTLLIFIPPS